ncbi:hypothetical protein ES703_34048 [subsurface metagenome]
MVEESQSMGFSTTELGSHVKNCRSFDSFSRKTSYYLTCHLPKAFGQKGTLEETHWVLVIFISPPISNLIQMHGELGCIQWFPLSQIFSGGNYFVPRFKISHLRLSIFILSSYLLKPQSFFLASTPSTQRFSSVSIG